jgi:wyosine [tRNA(Phe)-imidazoG37] synthetase (radical SAM superfamily)
MLARRYPSIDSLTFSGTGEPTLHPEFPEAVQMVEVLRKRHLPYARLALLTNGTKLGKKGIADAVRKFDIKCVKLDAGSKWMNRPREGIDVNALIPAWSEIPSLTLQSFFSEGRFDNTRNEFVDPWIQQVKAIKPRHVQLYTLGRGPAVGAMEKASLSTLSRVGRRLASEVDTEVQVFE